MAKSATPTAKLRRKMLAGDDSNLSRTGQDLLEQGRWGEALQCLSAADSKQEITQLATQAWDAGDLFFWQQAKAALKEQPTAEEYSQLAAKAEALGKAIFAQQARELAQGDQGES